MAIDITADFNIAYKSNHKDGVPIKAAHVRVDNNTTLDQWIAAHGNSAIKIVKALNDADGQQNTTYWVPSSDNKSYDVYTFDGTQYVKGGNITVDLQDYIPLSYVETEATTGMAYGTIYRDGDGKLKAAVPTSGEGGNGGSNVTIEDSKDGVIITVDGVPTSIKNGTSVKAVSQSEATEGGTSVVKLYSDDARTQEIGSFSVKNGSKGLKGDKGEDGVTYAPAGSVSDNLTITFSAIGKDDVIVNVSKLKGEKGEPGTNGTNGTDGTNGVDGTSCTAALYSDKSGTAYTEGSEHCYVGVSNGNGAWQMSGDLMAPVNKVLEIIEKINDGSL